MTNDKLSAPPSAEVRRKHHLRVPVSQSERTAIEANAKQAGISVARYLRDVGQGYRVEGVMDYSAVRDLVRVNGDLGRLGGLLKLWLTDDARTARFGDETIRTLLHRIELTQDELRVVMERVIKPKSMHRR